MKVAFSRAFADMFYNSDILSRRKTGLGVVWLAATLGSKSSVRRLSRKDIMAVNVSKACTMVRSPNEPMALRLSSQLLYGVVKIYHQQAEIWMQDVSTAHVSIRRQMSVLSEPGHSSIDMPKPPAKHLEAITMRLDMSYFALDIGQDALMYVDTFTLRDTTPSQGLSDGFRTPTPVPSRFVATEEQITLPGRYLDDEVGVARQREEDLTMPAFADGFGDDEGYDGLDLGLDQPGAPAVPFPEGLQEGLEPLPQGDMSGFVGSSSVGWSEMGHGAMQEATQMNLELVPGALATPARRPFPYGDDEAEIEALLGPARRRPRPNPRLEPLQDAVTELTDEELRHYRRDYVELMIELRSDQAQRRSARAAGQFARSAIFGPPSDMQQSLVLGRLWETTIGFRFSEIEDHYRQLRAETQRADSGPVSSSPLMPFPLQDFGGASDDDMGVPRAAVDQIPAELKGPRESLPWNMYMAERRRSSLLPSVSYDRAPFEREGTPLQFAAERSINTPLGLRSQPGPRESPIAVPGFGTPSTVAGLDEFPFQAPGTPSVEAFRLNVPPQSFTAQNSPVPPSRHRFETPPAQADDEDLHLETKNFLEFSYSVRDDLADPRGFLFFGDLAPVASSSPEIAAQAFCHTLALASSGTFKVKQDQPYQEIQISIST